MTTKTSAMVIPAACSCAALRQATRHVTRLYDETLAPAGLGLNQYSILAKLDRFGPRSIQDLATRLFMDRSTLGHLIRPLQTRGLIAIETSSTDRRMRLISLTADGLAMMAQARPLWAAAERRFEAAYGRAHAANLRSMLARAAMQNFDAV